jgi:hypothetical protein
VWGVIWPCIVSITVTQGNTVLTGIEMKYILAAIYSNFQTVIIDDTDIEQIDFYIAPPKSGKLLIQLLPIPW